MSQIDSYLQVEGSPSLVRDVGSSAIVNKDTTAFEAYVRSRSTLKKKDSELQRQAAELECMRNELSEIKQMLSQLMDKE